jgi:hypothetical protein
MQCVLKLAVVAVSLACGACCMTGVEVREELSFTATGEGGAFAKPVVNRVADPSRLDAKGYIRQWLVLMPITYGDKYVPADIDKDQLPNEGGMMPKAGEVVKVKMEEGPAGLTKTVEKELAWQAVVPDDFFIDFNQLGQLDGSESVGAYAVAYLDVPEEMTGVKLSLSTNDNGKLFLNGTSVFKFVGARGLVEDSDAVENVTLKKGVNVVVFKIWNDSSNWQACLRILGKDGKPVQGVRVGVTR